MGKVVPCIIRETGVRGFVIGVQRVGNVGMVTKTVLIVNFPVVDKIKTVRANLIADILSRDIRHPTPNFSTPDLDEQVLIRTVGMKITDTKLIELAENTRQDQNLQTVKKYISEGWPVHKKSIPSSIKPYYDFKEDLYLWKDIICKGPAIVIPEKQRTKVLQQIHAAHLGINASLSRARNKVYWPGMNRDIEEAVKSCRQCQRFRPAQTKEPLIPHRIPTYPWQEATADIFYLASSPYLLIVDRYSAYPEVYKMLPNRLMLPKLFPSSKKLFRDLEVQKY
ncbi:uncharacterized protein K02A2.6-like [Centruroides sculpturatus]|uniref:uncharacterized protein K02A2.6-like n=1 Tax=Centruroides sculpturatus TaxID=218467 RepID=UPI000C6CC960|nr:uncharacterized protein K02A2.6-like [Centruroides sculpturatus]